MTHCPLNTRDDAGEASPDGILVRIRNLTDTSRSACLSLLAVGSLGFSATIAQLVLMRELLAAFSGNELVLGIVLGNWLLLSGLGAWIGRAGTLCRDKVGWLSGALIAVALLPLIEVFTLRAMRDVVFIRGAAAGIEETIVGSFVVLLPFCLVSGALLTFCCALQPRDSAKSVGRVYIADSVGSILGGLLFTFVFASRLDHLAMLCVPAFVSLAIALVISLVNRRWLPGAFVGTALVAAAVLGGMDQFSTVLQYPHQQVLYRANSPYGRLVVTRTGEQLNFIENRVPTLSSQNVADVEETVHYAMSQRPDSRNVLLIGGGISGTARELLKYPKVQVTYVELDPALVELGKRFLPQNLADARIHVAEVDGRLFVRDSAQKFDVVIVDLPDPFTSQINRFYTVEFLRDVKRTLTPDGVLAFGLGRYASYVSPELARLLSSSHRTVKEVFSNALMIPGSRVFFLVSNGELHADIAGRLEQIGVVTHWVRRAYLDAMLTADRMADLQRAVAQPSAVNRDFYPILYFYHLLYWTSQFANRFGWLLLLGAMVPVVLVLRLRAPAIALFVSGFSASALEVVILLAVQILCGALYQRLGLIVTMFMAGLAIGAFAGNRSPRPGNRMLGMLTLGLGMYSLALPYVLAAAGWFANVVVVQALIALVTLVLGGIVGMQFPVASHLIEGAAPAIAARLYVADFVGAFIGALLASAFLLPMLGVEAVCWLTAALNVVVGMVLLLRRVHSP